ncbi:hypothetical protein CONPUDRAFT_136091 [Coniophora puteana RWD-64-598 SS2]|uniref:F-box domain-containing protein n=1 Tax=Coniophora puteana (strain RWD-64-598) TaxID=741705 RepID=A0A5M3MVW3_CONPW|nr:uncharacterized protein CONPUDRAFT_136091 [Coniophora puteana RWD-64-598 SS2]EIW82864.1 hypothetical protein CONPUDRAFT_136091 [Coniophora puteana RWD-64-598 SS2]
MLDEERRNQKEHHSDGTMATLRPVALLPFELLISILDLACAPPALLDPNLWRGPNSAWSQNLRFQKSLTLVCKTWNPAANELLYHHAVIRRVAQLPLLVKTLRSDSTSERPPMVKKLSVLCYASKTHRSVLDLSLKAVLSICTSIRHVVFNPVLDTSVSSLFNAHPDWTFPAFACVPEACSSRITHIELGTSVPIAYAVPELARFSNLAHLACEISAFALAPDGGEPYTFPRLVSLDLIWLTRERRDIVGTFRSIAVGLRLPALRRLALSAPYWGRGSAGACFAAFLETHGARLRYLAVVVATYLHEFAFSDVQALTNACPELEHLVVPHVEELEGLVHPRVVWLDVWSAVRGFEPADADGLLAEKYAGMPRLRGVRVLDFALCSLYGLGLPLLIEPELCAGFGDEDEAEVSWEYPGMLICARKYFVFQPDMDEGLPAYGRMMLDDPELWEDWDEERLAEILEDDNVSVYTDDSDFEDTDDEGYLYDTGSESSEASEYVPSESEDSDVHEDAMELESLVDAMQI